METKVKKWGNSLALRIPKAFVEEMGLALDTAVNLTYEQGRLVIVPVRKTSYSLAELLDQITPDNLHEEILVDGSVGNEVW